MTGGLRCDLRLVFCLALFEGRVDSKLCANENCDRWRVGRNGLTWRSTRMRNTAEFSSRGFSKASNGNPELHVFTRVSRTSVQSP